MSDIIKIKEDPNTGDLFFSLDKVLEGTNVKHQDVHYYELVEKNGSMVLTLYDKDKKQIKVENE